MGRAEEDIATLQRFVDRYAEDVNVVLRAAQDTGTTPNGKRLLVGALNYVLDMLDMFPDHYKGLGVADDALVLRLAAEQAVGEGANHAELARLAKEATDVEQVFAELIEGLRKWVATLPERPVRGRTATQILSSKDVWAVFEADVGREVKGYKPQTIDTSTGGPDFALNELRKMARHTLKKAGISN